MSITHAKFVEFNVIFFKFREHMLVWKKLCKYLKMRYRKISIGECKFFYVRRIFSIFAIKLSRWYVEVCLRFSVIRVLICPLKHTAGQIVNKQKASVLRHAMLLAVSVNSSTEKQRIREIINHYHWSGGRRVVHIEERKNICLTAKTTFLPL